LIVAGHDGAADPAAVPATDGVAVMTPYPGAAAGGAPCAGHCGAVEPVIVLQESPNPQINNSFRHPSRVNTNRRQRRIRDSSDENGAVPNG
jgi:hypothetical protein